jgi:hypothetical protein
MYQLFWLIHFNAATGSMLLEDKDPFFGVVTSRTFLQIAPPFSSTHRQS